MGQGKVVKEGKVVQALDLGKTEMVGNGERKAKTESSCKKEGAAIYTTALRGTRHGVDGSTVLWYIAGHTHPESETRRAQQQYATLEKMKRPVNNSILMTMVVNKLISRLSKRIKGSSGKTVLALMKT